jgi:hypothetical protein
MNLYEYANQVGAFSDRLLGVIAHQLFTQLAALHANKIHIGIINPSMIIVRTKGEEVTVEISNIVPILLLKNCKK